jgi:hypothetical protein
LQIISLELATVELRATTLPAHLQAAPGVEARVAVCKFFALKISTLRFLKTIDLRQNKVLQLAENRWIARSPLGREFTVTRMEYYALDTESLGCCNQLQ